MPSVNNRRLIQLLLEHHGRIEDIISAGRNQKIHAMLLKEQRRLMKLIDNLQGIADAVDSASEGSEDSEDSEDSEYSSE